MLHFGQTREQIRKNAPGMIHRARDGGVKMIGLGKGANFEVEPAAFNRFVQF